MNAFIEDKYKPKKRIYDDKNKFMESSLNDEVNNLGELNRKINSYKALLEEFLILKDKLEKTIESKKNQKKIEIYINTLGPLDDERTKLKKKHDLELIEERNILKALVN